MTDPARTPEYKETPLPRGFLRRQVFLFFTALGFLTCLAPAKPVSLDALRRSCVWYPAVGLTLGLLLGLPLLFIAPEGRAWGLLWALAWVAVSARLTRALHYDGLADVLDALGSGKTGDGFRAVLKDSRIGTFGVLGLVLVVLGQVSTAALLLMFVPEGPEVLILAPVFGRCVPIFLALLAPAHPLAGLGAITCAAPKPSCLFTAAAFILLTPFFCLPFLYAVLVPALSVILLIPVLAFLARAARREGGLNGDFFGCAIIAGECAVLLAACIVL